MELEEGLQGEMMGKLVAEYGLTSSGKVLFERYGACGDVGDVGWAEK
ncbi:hypothetical protein [Ktedonobacter robiniae]|uniref:Uncharacterized protein n=1 Tax=Ktedonobacter robiniae TaxID=2778365 RepID=A0ABQ3V317_9CHLR|nr:hypothetical protein [Ktedonobacter robiniae]GHO59030.1 hypothetical protein KSB_75050 [Ktedonobacter robiniae]